MVLGRVVVSHERGTPVQSFFLLQKSHRVLQKSQRVFQRASRPLKVLHEKGIELKPSGNEGYYTNSLILLVKNMLCGKLHCQKGCDYLYRGLIISHDYLLNLIVSQIRLFLI